MSVWVSFIIAEAINNFVTGSLLFFDFYKDYNGNKKHFVKKYVIQLLLTTIIINIITHNISKTITTIIKMLGLGLFFRAKFKGDFSKVFMNCFLMCVIFALYDCLFGLIYIGILDLKVETFNNSPLGIFSVNLILAICTLITVLFTKIGDIVRNISNWYSEKSIISTIVNIALCIITLWFFISKTVTTNTPIYEYLINSVVIFTITIFFVGFFKENSDKNQLKKKYDSLIDYAKTYEQEVVEKSKWQHEYENQLIIVKSKINKENDEAHQYIDKLLRNKPTDENSKWLTKLSQFPDIGIKGLLHYKICQMKDLEINVYVDVTNDVEIKKNSKISKILEENLQDISRILGVYIDNAIQAAKQANKKYIICEFKTSKNNIVFQISNTYSGKLDLEKIGQEKFTTKGRGHGYGLSLTKDILDKNDYLSQNREINGMYYVQQLIVDIKKKV